jgi:spore germination cell wall hydrolase CwlJ-like protein
MFKNFSKLFLPIAALSLIITAVLLSNPIGNLNAAERPLKVSYEDLNHSARQQVDCLAQNMYFESGWEPQDGQIAVAMVTLNRQESGDFAPTICGVVKQKIANTCQFSWVCEYKTINNINRDVYLRVRDLAVYVYANRERIKDPSLGALYYHADYVRPGWKNMIYLTKIGHHKFYNRKDA